MIQSKFAFEMNTDTFTLQNLQMLQTLSLVSLLLRLVMRFVSVLLQFSDLILCRLCEAHL